MTDDDLLGDILGNQSNPPNEEPSPGLDVETNDLEPSTDSSGGVQGSRLEVAGVVMDNYGNKWQVPGDNVEDFDDLYAGDVYGKIPKELSDKFHVQMILQTQLNEYIIRHFVPVLQEELGIPAEMIRDFGHPLDRYHRVGDSIMVKIPHEIRNRIEARKIKETKERLMQLEPTEAMLKGGIDHGMSVEHRMGFSSADPAKRQGFYATKEVKA